MGQGTSQLLHAAATGELDLLSRLLDQGVDVNAAEEGTACAGCKGQCQGCGIENSIALSSPEWRPGCPTDENGQTPLHKAALQGQLELVQELIARGGDVNARLQDGMTATHLAAWKGHLTILEYLLNSGANVNIGDIGGQTALHTAAEAGQEAACRALRQFGADVSVRDSQARSAADLARASNLPRLAEELKPPAVLRVQAENPEPSAPVWQKSSPSPSSSGPISYPTVAHFYPGEDAAESSSSHAAGDKRERQIIGRLADDWEPKPEEDWEGVEAPQAVPSRGHTLMQTEGEQVGSQDPFWLVPGPVKWAAGNIGNMLANFNPFRGQPHQESAASDEERSEENDAHVALERKEEEVAHLSEPKTKETLTKEQLARLQEQEAEIAVLKARLAKGSSAQPSGDPGLSQGPMMSQQEGETAGQAGGHEQSSYERHHLFDMPTISQSQNMSCREATAAEMAEATDNFSGSRLLSSTPRGSFYRGTLQGQAVAIWVPQDRHVIPWQQVKSIADRIAALNSQHLVPLKAVSQDGCEAYELMLNGRVDRALTGDHPMPGRPAVRLDWLARVSVAQAAARGIADLRTASVAVSKPVTPSRMLLSESAAPRLRPPSIQEIASGSNEVSAYSPPEVRMGAAPTASSDVYSLGMLMLQLVTGSEAAGLLDFAQKKVDQGKVEDIIDPCAEDVSVSQATDLVKLALRCTDYHAQSRPDLAAEVIPKLTAMSQLLSSRQSVNEEPPAHLVCPITQEVMENPVILADGYTYEREAIQKWLDGDKKTSPMTNEPLQHLNMTPNYVIKSAASSWRGKRLQGRSSHNSAQKRQLGKGPSWLLSSSSISDATAPSSTAAKAPPTAPASRPTAGGTAGGRLEAGRAESSRGRAAGVGLALDEEFDLPPAPTHAVPVWAVSSMPAREETNQANRRKEPEIS